MKTRKIINVTLVAFIIVGIFFVIKLDLIGKIENKIYQQKIDEATDEANEKKTNGSELITRTFVDKDGNEIVVEMRKIVVKDEGTGEEVVMYEDTAEPKIIHDYLYKGTVEKIENNKVYFMVDKESRNGSYFCEEVKDYKIIFDLSCYNTEIDTSVEYFVCDHLTLDFKDLDNAKDLEKLVGKYIRVQDSRYEDYYTSEEYEVLNFFTE